MVESPYAPGPNLTPVVPFTPTLTAVPITTNVGGECQCAPPVVTRVEPIPSRPDVVWGTEIVLPPPPDGPPTAGSRVPCRPPCQKMYPVPTSIAAGPARTPPFKFWNPLTWRARPASAAGGPNATANAVAKTPAKDMAKTPPVVAKVEVTPAQPGDWRQSWGKIESSKAPSAKTDLPAPPTVADAPTHLTLLPLPTANTPAKNPGATPPAPVAVPSSPTVAAPPKYPGALPPPTVATLPKYPGELPSPTVTTPTANPNPLPPAPVAVKTTRPDVPPPPPAIAAKPAHPGKSPVVSLPPVPSPLTAPPAAVNNELPHAQVKADDPLNDPEKYSKVPRPDGAFGPQDGPAKNKTSLFALLTGKPPPAKPTVPLGMKSALAAVVPDATKAGAAAKTTGAVSGSNAALGFDPNEPNAFSDPKVKPPSDMNAFTEPPSPPPPPADPQAVALAGNAFVNSEGPKSLGAPARSVLDTGLPTRDLTVPPAYPLPAPAAPRTAAPVVSPPAQAVVPVGYRPGSPYDLSPLVAVLRESLYPSQREEAAEQLGAMDWRRQPEVVDILVERARDDPAPTVRAECVRSLGRLKANTLPAVETVKFLQADEDVRVRHEADDAYATLTGTAPKAAVQAEATSPQ